MLDLIFSKIKYLFNKKISFFALIKGDSKINNKSKINRFVRFYSSQIGKYSYVGRSSNINHTIIGNYCSISWNCNIGLASHKISCLSTSPLFNESVNGTGTSWLNNASIRPLNKITIIGNDVWLGANVIVMQGLTIGDGAVVGAGSIVTKNVPAFAVVAGVPAKFIKWRFSEKIIDMLLEKQWWYSSDAEVRKRINIFTKEAVDINDILELPDFKV